MSRRDFIFLNGNGELYDLTARQPQMPDLAKMAPHELYVRVALAGRCSALVTVSRAPPCASACCCSPFDCSASESADAFA